MSEEIVQEEEILEDDTPVEEVETEEVETDTEEESPEVKELKDKLAKAEALIVKHKKAKKPKQQVNKTGSDEPDEIPEWGQKILATEDKRSFGYERNLSPETVDAVFQFTGGKTPTEQDMEHPAVKAIVKSLEAAKRVAANTPSGGSVPTYKGKTYAETVTATDATPDDKQKAMEAAAKRHGIT